MIERQMIISMRSLRLSRKAQTFEFLILIMAIVLFIVALLQMYRMQTGLDQPNVVAAASLKMDLTLEQMQSLVRSSWIHSLERPFDWQTPTGSVVVDSALAAQQWKSVYGLFYLEGTKESLTKRDFYLFSQTSPDASYDFSLHSYKTDIRGGKLNIIQREPLELFARGHGAANSVEISQVPVSQYYDFSTWSSVYNRFSVYEKRDVMFALDIPAADAQKFAVMEKYAPAHDAVLDIITAAISNETPMDSVVKQLNAALVLIFPQDFTVTVTKDATAVQFPAENVQLLYADSGYEPPDAATE